MNDESNPPAPALSGHRTRIVDQLCAHFAADRLTVDEFEQRVDAAHRASTLAELQSLTSDLVVPEQTTPAVAATTKPTVPAAEEKQLLFAILGGTERKGRWRPARQINIVTFMGGADIDFREAQFPPGETEVFLFCMMGGADIVVPPGLPVDVSGSAIMGGFPHMSTEPPTSPDAPRLKIRGFCMMGGVDINVRLPGESAKDARRRRKEEQRRLKSGG